MIAVDYYSVCLQDLETLVMSNITGESNNWESNKYIPAVLIIQRVPCQAFRNVWKGNEFLEEYVVKI